MTSSTILQKKYKNLYLQVSKKEIQFCIKDTLRNTIEILNSFETENILLPQFSEDSFSLAFKKIDNYQIEFDEVFVLHQNSWCTFVPNALFDSDFLSSYLQFSTAVFETDFITHDSIENYEKHCVYMPFVNINNFLIDKYGSFTYKHTASILVKKLLDFSKNKENPLLFIQINSNFFQLVVVQNQKLLFFNSFDFLTETDFIYHVLFTLEQLNLNAETVETNLIGEISKDHEIFKIAFKYIRNITLYTENNNLENAISKVDYLNYFNLIHLCE